MEVIGKLEENAAYIELGNTSIWKALRMALPLLGTSFIFCLIGVVDMAVAGWQGAAAQAAVGVADQSIFATMLIGTGLAAATGCFVSQAMGANQTGIARRYAMDGLALAAIFGTLSATICYFAADAVMQFSGCTQSVRETGVPYLKVCAFGNLPFMIVLVQAAILRAIGKTNDCLRMWTLIGLISIAGGVLLYLIEASPWHHSLTALAVSWNLGALVGMALTLFLLVSEFADSKSSCSQFPPATERIKAFCRVGIPVLLSEACYIASLFSIYALLGKLPGSENTQAAYSVTLKIEETFGILPLVAMSSVSATLVGHHIGAGLFKRARVLGWQFAFVCTGIMLIGGALVQGLTPQLAKLFSDSEAVVSCVRVGTAGATISMPLIAFAFILFASLEGAGRTALPLVAQFAGYILCRLPLAYLFTVTFEMGFFGIWLAIFISRIALAIMAAIIFRSVDLKPVAISMS